MENEKTDQDLKNITSMWTDISIRNVLDIEGDPCCMLISVENTKGNFYPTLCRNGDELINEIKKILLHSNN